MKGSSTRRGGRSSTTSTLPGVLGSGCGVLTSKIVHGNQVVWGTPARPLKEYLAQLANVARLGDLKAEVKELRVRVEELCKK